MNPSEIPGYFGFFDVYNLFVSSAPEGSTIVELGSFKGRSFSHLLELANKSSKKLNLVSIDTFKGSAEHNESKLYEEFKKNIDSLYFKYPYITIVGESVNVSKIFTEKSIYAVLIDASHEYEDVRNDIEAWKPKIIPGGYIAGDDYDWPGVRKAVKEILPEAVGHPRAGDCVIDIKAGNYWILKL